MILEATAGARLGYIESGVLLHGHGGFEPDESCERDRCSLGVGGGLLGTVRLEPLVIAPDVQG